MLTITNEKIDGSIYVKLLEFLLSKCDKVSFAENVYELNISDLTLYQLGSNFNLLDTPVGGTVWTYFKSSDNELIVDSLTLSMFFYKINVSSTVDFESDTVFITNNNSYQ